MTKTVHQHPEEEFLRAGLHGNPPCPICDGISDGDWCGYNSFLCSCMRVEEGSFKTVIQPKTGKPAYLHWLKPGTVSYIRTEETKAPKVETASVEIRDRVYREFLSLLSLSREHKEDLLRRGLSEGDIKKKGYKSITKARKPWDICKMLQDRWLNLSGIPGFYKAEGTHGGSYWTFSWVSCYLIPVLDGQGRIQALQRRVDNSKKVKSRYMLMSSSEKKSGSKSGTPAHVAIPSEITDGRIWVTEGPLKADIAAKYLGAVVIGLMSAGTWVPAMGLIKELAPKEIILAYDMDFRTNKDVGEPLKLLRAKMDEMGLTVKQAIWNGVKGIDDALVNGRKITIDSPVEWEYPEGGLLHG